MSYHSSHHIPRASLSENAGQNVILASSQPIEALQQKKQQHPVRKKYLQQHWYGNQLYMGESGSGKTIALKQFIYRHVHPQGPTPAHETPPPGCMILDPEGEYLDLVQEARGRYLVMTPQCQHTINPFDLFPIAHSPYLTTKSNMLDEHITQLAYFFDLLISTHLYQNFTKKEKKILIEQLYETYRQAGITHHSETHHLQPPLLHNFIDCLTQSGQDTTGIVSRLQEVITHPAVSIFTHHTNINFNQPVIGFGLHHLPPRAKIACSFLIIAHLRTISRGTHHPRWLIIDELSTVCSTKQERWLLKRVIQSTRYTALTLITSTFLPNILDQIPLLPTCETVILLAHSPHTYPLLQRLFQIPEEECIFLRPATRGEALIIQGNNHFGTSIELTEEEHRLFCGRWETDDLVFMASRPIQACSSSEYPSSAHAQNTAPPLPLITRNHTPAPSS